ncbi:MAG: Os1348 family NHLP clan protein [Chloroflexota bacterium]|nr:Os1348 family NHLP clan protein [Chloroflexota bacterium]
MSKDALAKVVQRAISDAAFRRQLNSDPTGALRGFDLSSDELSALRTGDAGRLSTLGIDQRMSKAFAIGGALASTRMSQSDLTPGGGPAMVDDLSGSAGRTVIPGDPAQVGSADVDGAASGTRTARVGDDYKFASKDAPGGSGTNTARVGDDYKFASKDAPGGSGTNTVRAGDDWKFTDRIAPEGGAAVRTGDDWKFADRAASQGAVAPVEGSPEASAADIAGGTRASAINDDPNGFLAANATARGSVAPVEGSPEASAADIAGATRVSAINDDPNGFLAANADAGGSVTRANVIHDDPNGFLAANADASGTASSGDGTAFIDESESYLTKVGYDSSAATSSDSTYSGDDIAGPSSIADAGDSPHAATDEGQITPS